MIIKSFYSLVSLLGSSIVFLALVVFSFLAFPTNISLELLLVLLISSALIFVLRIFFKGERRKVKSFERKMLRKGADKSKVRAFLARVEARSFASAHVARLSGLGAVLFFNEFALEALLLVFVVALVVGFARVKLGRHNALDVFTGFVIGVVSGYLAGQALPLFSS